MNKLAGALSILLAITILAAFGTELYVKGVPTVTLSIFQKPCTEPIKVKIQSIDPKFNLSKAQLETSLNRAVTLWNTAAGKEVIVYAPDNLNSIPVSLVYDERQQTVNLGQKIDSTEAKQMQARTHIEELQAAYEKAGAEYDSAGKAFTDEANAYQKEVAQVNASGGADQTTFDRLKAEQTHLKDVQTALTAQGNALTVQGDDLKKEIAAFNATVQNVNSIVESFNSKAGGDFEEGQYIRDSAGQRIFIYAYKTDDELLHSLAHEFGHALGLDHNNNPASIMYPYNKSGTKVSADDLASLKKVCGL